MVFIFHHPAIFYTRYNKMLYAFYYNPNYLISIYEKLNIYNNGSKADIYIATIGNNLIQERIILCSELRRAGFICDLSHSNNPKMGKQLNYVLENNIPIMIVIGESEINNNSVQLKIIKDNIQKEIKRSDFINELKKYIK